ncbi:hypothetical protein ACI2OX_11175 [Bacillus sp. N9]
MASKSLIILVSIITFGTVTPSHPVWSEEQGVAKSQQRGNLPGILQVKQLLRRQYRRKL